MTCMAVLFLMNRTEPSHIREFAPPGWLLNMLYMPGPMTVAGSGGGAVGVRRVGGQERVAHGIDQEGRGASPGRAG